jgi:hypothetical protein
MDGPRWPGRVRKEREKEDLILDIEDYFRGSPVRVQVFVTSQDKMDLQ